MLVLLGRPRRESDGDARARDERLSAHEVTRLLAVPSINTALRGGLDELGLAMEPSSDGYHFVDRGVVAEREYDDVQRDVRARSTLSDEARSLAVSATAAARVGAGPRPEASALAT